MKINRHQEFSLNAVTGGETLIPGSIMWKVHSVGTGPPCRRLKLDIIPIKGAQPLIFVVSYKVAIVCSLESEGIRPDFSNIKSREENGIFEVPEGPISNLASALMENTRITGLVAYMGLHLTLIEKRLGEIPTIEIGIERPMTVYKTEEIAQNYPYQISNMEIDGCIYSNGNPIYMIASTTIQIEDCRLQNRA